ncbi:hypothetical protein V8C86DRAFT_2645542 [Haematococcus lacustris]
MFLSDRGLMQRAGLDAAANVVLTIYLHRVVCKLQPGAQRLLASVPVIAILLTLPLLFDPVLEVVPSASVLFMSAWLGTFKVLALCLGRGSLSRPLTLLQFFMLLLLPIYPAAGPDKAEGKRKGRLQDSGGTPLQLLLSSVLKIGLLGFTVYLLLAVELPIVVRDLVSAFAMVGFLGMIMDLPATVVTSLVDLRIVPTFDSPWLCTSLADFWGRRWNITTSSVLRVLVYDPIVEGRLVASDDVHPKRLAAAQQLAAEPQPVLMFTSAAAGPTSRGALEPLAPASAKASAAVCEDEQPSHASSTDPDSASEDRSDVSTGMSEEGPTKSSAAAVTASRERPSAATRPPRWRRVCGTLATFLVSGLMHEWIMYMLMPRFLGPWTGKWTVYFTMQGPLLLCEVELKRAWRRAGLRPLPFLLACALTWATLLVVAVPFFFGAVQPPHGNLAPRVVAAVRDSFAAVGQLVAGHPVVAKLLAGQPTLASVVTKVTGVLV